MSVTTWSQYISMDEPSIEPGRVEAALDTLEGWDDDFELGAAWEVENTQLNAED